MPDLAGRSVALVLIGPPRHSAHRVAPPGAKPIRTAVGEFPVTLATATVPVTIGTNPLPLELQFSDTTK